ncbi:beta-eliminating lyase [Triangularia verruculosa]|uniref:Beta-eliminating lyase n=1 Tax=Triangularia verruculosa TaxID=2587418 RepID=A0AAN6X9R3_9PEZI|nr:beta-eliminating lyase [Triangularia verruculosa]
MACASKYSFHDDYSEGAHPAVLEALSRANHSQQNGYGNDEHCKEARKAIHKLIGSDTAHIYFVPSGTSANLLSIASHLRPHEAVIAAEPAHIVGKEGGAIEATGHKILISPGINGKLTPEHIQSAFGRNTQFAYQPKPKMVFIANATELGTVYTAQELEPIAAICKHLGLLLLMDGARLGAAMASSKNDLSLKDFYRLTDIFWIGGTKNGALLGEAVVIKDPIFGAEFPYHMKQRGMLLAKSRVLGIQFGTLFKDDLFFQIAKTSVEKASKLAVELVGMGFELWKPVESNQVFVIFPEELVWELEKQFDFFVWEHLDDGHKVVRLVTSWATLDSKVEELLALVRGGP